MADNTCHTCRFFDALNSPIDLGHKIVYGLCSVDALDEQIESIPTQTSCDEYEERGAMDNFKRY